MSIFLWNRQNKISDLIEYDVEQMTLLKAPRNHVIREFGVMKTLLAFSLQCMAVQNFPSLHFFIIIITISITFSIV